MKVLKYYFRLFCSVACFVWASDLLYGQQNCLLGCTESISIDGELFSFQYTLDLDPKYGTIAYKNGTYLLNLKKDGKLKKIKLTFSSLPSNFGLFFSKHWNSTNDFLQLPYPCKKISDVGSANGVVIQLNENGGFGSATLSFRVALGNVTTIDCKDVEVGAEFQFSFVLNGKKEEEKIPVPVVIKPVQDGKNPITVDSSPDPIEVNPPSIELSKEEKDWKAAKRRGTLNAFKNFKVKYEGHDEFMKYRERVNEAIAKRDSITHSHPQEIPNGYKVFLGNVFDSIKVDTMINATATYRFEKNKSKAFSQTLFITHIDGESIKLLLYDEDKPSSVNTISISVGNHLGAILYCDKDSSRIDSIKFDKGVPPYHVYILKNGVIVQSKTIDASDNPWKPKADFLAESNLLGEIEIRASDEEKAIPFIIGKIKVLAATDWTAYWLGGLAFVLLGLVFIYPKIKQRKTARNINRYMSERLNQWEAHKKVVEEQKKSFVENTTEKIEEGGNEYIDKKDITLPLKEGKRKIKITSRKKAIDKGLEFLDERLLDELLKNEFSLRFDTMTLWENTMISAIYFTKKSTTDLDRFLREQNLVPLQENEGEIPEIGGMLLGRPFFSKEKGSYRVLVEEFIPIAAEYQDKYQLTFSAESMAKDLDLDKFPDLRLVGWFHTHPGHGLFLSRPDLRIHDTFFKETYQFAMEIDSISTNLDTGFFTRMKNGKVNNRKNLRTHANWYSWLEVGNHR